MKPLSSFPARSLSALTTLLLVGGIGFCAVSHAQQIDRAGSPGAAIGVGVQNAIVPPDPAGTPTPQTLPPEKAAIEVMYGHGFLSSGLGGANAVSVRGMDITSSGVLQAEAVHQSRFGFSGNYGSVGLTRDLSPDYYMSASAGAGSGLLFPNWRVDATGYRKFGNEKQYVVGLGGYYAEGNEAGRSDIGLLLSGVYYA
jgi:hypothetical protein